MWSAVETNGQATRRGVWRDRSGERSQRRRGCMRCCVNTPCDLCKIRQIARDDIILAQARHRTGDTMQVVDQVNVLACRRRLAPRRDRFG